MAFFIKHVTFAITVMTSFLTGQCLVTEQDKANLLTKNPLMRENSSVASLDPNSSVTSLDPNSSVTSLYPNSSVTSLYPNSSVTSLDSTIMPLSSGLLPGLTTISNEQNIHVDLHAMECFSFTYNSTRHIYNFTTQKFYVVWFMPLMKNTNIKLRFEYTMYREDRPPHFVDYTKYEYETIPHQWHQIRLKYDDAGLCHIKLNIPEIQLKECMSHNIISRMQVASENTLVIWSVCPPGDNWGNSTVNSGVDATPIIAVSICFAAAFVALILVGIYAWQQRQKLKKAMKRSGDEEPVYAEWRAVGQTDALSFTPPSSVSYESNGNNTFNTSLSK